MTAPIRSSAPLSSICCSVSRRLGATQVVPVIVLDDVNRDRGCCEAFDGSDLPEHLRFALCVSSFLEHEVSSQSEECDRCRVRYGPRSRQGRAERGSMVQVEHSSQASAARIGGEPGDVGYTRQTLSNTVTHTYELDLMKYRHGFSRA